MIEAFCDKCGEKVTLKRFYEQKIKISNPFSRYFPNNIVKQTDYLLCEKCERDFCDWMGISFEELSKETDTPF